MKKISKSTELEERLMTLLTYGDSKTKEVAESMYNYYSNNECLTEKQVNYLKILVTNYKRQYQNKRSALKKSEACVYFISDVCSGMVKIGLAKNAYARLADLQVANPNKLKLVKRFIFDCRHRATKAERILHIIFEDFSVRGEWFKMEVLDFLDNLDIIHIHELPNHKMSLNTLERLVNKNRKNINCKVLTRKQLGKRKH